MSDDAAHLRRLADQCRVVAAALMTLAFRDELEMMAIDLEAKADWAERSSASSSD